MITLYSQSGCMPCRATKRQLDKAGAPYTLVDVTEHPEAVDRIRELGYTGTPVVEVQLDDGIDHWQGHREDKGRSGRLPRHTRGCSMITQPITTQQTREGSAPARIHENRATVSRPRSLNVPIPRGPFDEIVANVIVELNRYLLGAFIPAQCLGFAPWQPPSAHKWRLIVAVDGSVDGVVCHRCGQVIA